MIPSRCLLDNGSDSKPAQRGMQTRSGWAAKAAAHPTSGTIPAGNGEAQGSCHILGLPWPPLVCWLLPQALWQKEPYKHLQLHFACKAASLAQEMSVWVKGLPHCCKQCLRIVSCQITPEFTFSSHTSELDFHLSVRRHTINITDRL